MDPAALDPAAAAKEHLHQTRRTRPVVDVVPATAGMALAGPSAASAAATHAPVPCGPALPETAVHPNPEVDDVVPMLSTSQGEDAPGALGSLPLSAEPLPPSEAASLAKGRSAPPPSAGLLAAPAFSGPSVAGASVSASGASTRGEHGEPRRAPGPTELAVVSETVADGVSGRIPGRTPGPEPPPPSGTLTAAPPLSADVGALRSTSSLPILAEGPAGARPERISASLSERTPAPHAPAAPLGVAAPLPALLIPPVSRRSAPALAHPLPSAPVRLPNSTVGWVFATEAAGLHGGTRYAESDADAGWGRPLKKCLRPGCGAMAGRRRPACDCGHVWEDATRKEREAAAALATWASAEREQVAAVAAAATPTARTPVAVAPAEGPLVHPPTAAAPKAQNILAPEVAPVPPAAPVPVFCRAGVLALPSVADGDSELGGGPCRISDFEQSIEDRRPDLLDPGCYLGAAPDIVAALAGGGSGDCPGAPAAPLRLYPWQAAALLAGDAGCLALPLGSPPDGPVLRGEASLVYCAPTSGGKSLVADILALRRILATRRPALYVLPFVALCDEKADRLDKLLGSVQPPLRTKRLYGREGSRSTIDPDTGAVVATIEQAHRLVGKLAEEGSLGRLGCVVVDELHMVGEGGSRGALLELALTKLRFAGVTQGPESAAPSADGSRLDVGACTGQLSGAGGVQIIGMSATLPNLSTVAGWLDARLYVTGFRPVPLIRSLVVPCDKPTADHGAEVKDKRGRVLRVLRAPETNDPDHLIRLVRETVDGQGAQVLVFCGYKKSCEVEARRIAKAIQAREQPRGVGSEGYISRKDAAANISAANYRPGQPFHVDRNSLAECVAKGVAWHHANLTREERETVAAAYRSGSVSVICATSTLAAGVNLPARRVIFKVPFIGRSVNGGSSCPMCDHGACRGHLYDVTKYRQMCGRAGRTGHDDRGEAIMLAGLGPNRVPEATLMQLMQAEPERARSQLAGLDGWQGMVRPMLDAVTSGLVRTREDIDRFLRCTLLSHAALAGENDEDLPDSVPIEDENGDLRGGGQPAWDRVVRPAAMQALRWLEGGVNVLPPQKPPTDKGGPADPTMGEARAAAAPVPPLRRLVRHPFIRWDESLCAWSPTSLAHATVASSLPAPVALHLHADLLVARAEGLILDNDLHLSVLSVPLDTRLEVNYDVCLQIYKTLNTSDHRVAQRVFAAVPVTHGLCHDIKPISLDQLMQRRARGAVSGRVAARRNIAGGARAAPACVNEATRLEYAARLERAEGVAKRYFLAHVLRDVAREVPLPEVKARYGMDGGAIEELQEQSGRWAALTAAFCERFDWQDLRACLELFSRRVLAGSLADVASLAEVRHVRPAQARVLYRGGVRTPGQLARADVRLVARLLREHEAAAGAAGPKDKLTRWPPRRPEGYFERLAVRFKDAALERVKDEMRSRAEDIRALEEEAGVVLSPAGGGGCRRQRLSWQARWRSRRGWSRGLCSLRGLRGLCILHDLHSSHHGPWQWLTRCRLHLTLPRGPSLSRPHRLRQARHLAPLSALHLTSSLPRRRIRTVFTLNGQSS